MCLALYFYLIAMGGSNPRLHVNSIVSKIDFVTLSLIFLCILEFTQEDEMLSINILFSMVKLFHLILRLAGDVYSKLLECFDICLSKYYRGMCFTPRKLAELCKCGCRCG